MNWYYSLNGQQTGPVTEAQLTALISSGAINTSTLVWKEGMPDWQAISIALPSNNTDAPQIGGVAVPAGQKDTFVQQMREGVASTAPGMMQYGGFWIRFVAKFVDGIILRVAGLLLGLIMGFAISGMKDGGTGQSIVGVMMILVGIGINVLYETLMVAKYGATLGKMATGLKVVRSDGSPLSMGLSCGRAFAGMLSSFTLMIGYIMAGFDTEKRALHDRICDTRVIKTR